MNEDEAREVLKPYINKDDTLSGDGWSIKKPVNDNKYHFCAAIWYALQMEADGVFPGTQKDTDALNWWIENKYE